MEDSKSVDVDRRQLVRNRLEELNDLNEKFLQTAASEADIHFYNAVQSILHATALKLYGYTESRDYKIEADLHQLVSQLEYIRLLESAVNGSGSGSENKVVVLSPQGPRIEYTDQRQKQQ